MSRILPSRGVDLGIDGVSNCPRSSSSSDVKRKRRVLDVTPFVAVNGRGQVTQRSAFARLNDVPSSLIGAKEVVTCYG